MFSFQKGCIETTLYKGTHFETIKLHVTAELEIFKLLILKQQKTNVSL